MQAALALVVAAAVTQAAQAKPIPSNRAVGPRTELAQGPLAGPWYTPQELRSLGDFSALTLQQRHQYLRSVEPGSSARDNDRHEQLLRGLAATVHDRPVASSTGSDWSTARAGGLGAMGLALLSAGGLLLAGRRRRQKPALL